MRAAQMQQGDLPTWLAALGTVGALGAALWQIGAERKRRHEREADEREERRLAQARLISAVMGPEQPSGGRFVPNRTGIDLTNGSTEPVYRLVVGLVSIEGPAPQTIAQWIEYRDREPDGSPRFPEPVTAVSILPSGTYRVWVDGGAWRGGLSMSPGAEVAFTDRAGSHWIRHATGQLEQLAEDPVSYFLGAGPHDLQVPEHLS